MRSPIKYNLLSLYYTSILEKLRLLYCLCFHRYHDPPPTLLDMARLKKQSNGVNIKLAVANQGTVSFYGLFEVDLPTLVSFG